MLGGKFIIRLWQCAQQAKAMWFNMREEVLVYVKGRPLVLREDERPFKNMQVSGDVFQYIKCCKRPGDGNMPSYATFISFMQAIQVSGKQTVFFKQLLMFELLLACRSTQALMSRGWSRWSLD